MVDEEGARVEKLQSRVEKAVPTHLKTVVVHNFACRKPGCKRIFGLSGPRAMHERFCKACALCPLPPPRPTAAPAHTTHHTPTLLQAVAPIEEDATGADAQAGTAEPAETDSAGNDAVGDAAGAGESAADGAESDTTVAGDATVHEPARSNPPGKRQKLRADGGFKQSGLKQGDKRGKAYTLLFKLEVIQAYRQRQTLGEAGVTDAPQLDIAERYTIAQSCVSKWAKDEDKVREALRHGNVVLGRGKNVKHADKVVGFQHRAARLMTLHKGRKRQYASAEVEVFGEYKAKRAKGLRITAKILRALMKRTVRKHYGDMAADSFKASRHWLGNFARNYSITWRRKTNKKNVSIEMRRSAPQVPVPV